MDKLILMKPDISFKGEIQAFHKEMLDAESSMDGTGPLQRMDTIEAWLEFIRLCQSKETIPEDWVTSDQYLYVRQSDNRIVGMIDFRHYFNDFLEKYGGNIGYSIRPSERRKGYAKRMLSDCLQLCRQYGLEKVLITCTKENEASKRTILANGGVYEKTVYCEPDNVYLERYWIHL